MSASSPVQALRRNGGWLLALPMAFNVAFFDRLPDSFGPERFDVGIPAWLLGAEVVTRAACFGLPFVGHIGWGEARQRLGAVLYGFGLVAYFASWWMQIAWPQSPWSLSRIGFTAPAWTPGLWFLGVALLFEGPLFERPRRLRELFAASALAFLAVHIAHAWLAYPG